MDPPSTPLNVGTTCAFEPTAKVPHTTEIASATLQYLPIPVIVLSSSKTVVMANDALARLLSPAVAGRVRTEDNEFSAATSEAPPFLGQSLSQIGIDIVEDGEQAWASWEVMVLRNLGGVE